MGYFSNLDVDVRILLEEEADKYGLSGYDKTMYVDTNYDVTATKLQTLDSFVDTNWYTDIETIIGNLSKGKLDSITAVKKLEALGFSRKEIVQDILPNAVK